MTAVPLLTAVAPRWEADLASRVAREEAVHVVRRCADVAELLGSAAAGLGRLALVSSDLRGLDRSVVDGLHGYGLRVLGVHPPGDETARRALERWGCEVVTRADADERELTAALARLVEAPGGNPPAGASRHPASSDGPTGPAGILDAGEDPDLLVPEDEAAWVEAGATDIAGPATAEDLAGAAGRLAHDAGDADGPVTGDRRGRVLVVWGPYGSTGRTTTAVNLASELADPTSPVLLVDADTYGASVAQHLGILDEAPGIVAAARAADQGLLDREHLLRTAPQVRPGLRVLTGLPRADRWPELREVALADVLAQARRIATTTLVDVAAPVEQDEELSFDTAAPRRNGATLTALEEADAVVVVGTADPVGLQRLVRALDQLGEVCAAERHVVVTRVRPGPVGPDAGRRIRETLARFAGVEEVHLVPEDREAVDEAMLRGQTLSEARPRSTARAALVDLAAALAPGAPTVAPPVRRWLPAPAWRPRT